MLIVCPTCATTYQIAPAALGETGRSVRCASCKDTWFATPEVPAAAVAAPAVEQPPAKEPEPIEEEFDINTASNFAVEGIIPADDSDLANDADAALAETDAPPLAPGGPSDAEPVARFDPGTTDN